MNPLARARSRWTRSGVAGLLALVFAAASAGWMFLRSAGPGAGAEPSPFRLFVLGTSTGLGEPYTPRLDFGRLTRWYFGGRIGQRPIEVDNRSRAGKSTATLLEAARKIASDRYEPGTAAALLYLGNNEFLRFDTTHDLSAPQRRLFDQPTVSAQQRAEILREYAENVAAILETLQAAGITVVASTAAVNLKDWEPNRSVLANPGHEAPVRELLETGERAQAAGDPEAALAAYEQILAIEPSFALAAKKAGDCARALGRIDAARAHYQAAVDFDDNPYRETSGQNRLLREIAGRYRVPVVDAVGILEAASPDRLIGFELMWDNSHPTLAGYALIAEGFVAEIERALHVQRQRTAVDLPSLQRDLGIDEAFLARVYATRGQYCYMSATLTFDLRARLERSEFYLQQALARAPDDPDIACSLAVLKAMKGDAQASLAEWHAARALDPMVAARRASSWQVSQLMRRVGVSDLPALLASGRF